ncbi:MAG TPA: hypothetical protein VEA35_14785 [Ramlibacter sp.]|nr:hypothetical protein [Ramlibacter sp.]
MQQRTWLTLLLAVLLALRGGAGFAMNSGADRAHPLRAAAGLHHEPGAAGGARDCAGHHGLGGASEAAAADLTPCPLLLAAALPAAPHALPAGFAAPPPAAPETRFSSADPPPRFKPPIS